MPIYLKIEGVAGTVTSGKYKDWIELESCQLGFTRPGASTSGTGAGRVRNAPFTNIVVTKLQDNASQALFQLSMWGHGTKATIHFVNQVQNETSTYLTINLEDMLVASYSTSGLGGSGMRPIETISLDSTKITYVTTGAGDPPKKTAVK